MIAQFWNTGYDINNNNAPAQENMPTFSPNTTFIPTSSECTFKNLKSYPFFGGYVRGTVTNTQGFTSNEHNDKPHTFLAWFMYLFLMSCIKETLIIDTNAAIEVKVVALG